MRYQTVGVTGLQNLYRVTCRGTLLILFATAYSLTMLNTNIIGELFDRALEFYTEAMTGKDCDAAVTGLMKNFIRAISDFYECDLRKERYDTQCVTTTSLLRVFFSLIADSLIWLSSEVKNRWLIKPARLTYIDCCCHCHHGEMVPPCDCRCSRAR